MPYQADSAKRLKMFQIEWDQVSTPAEIKLDNLKIYEPKAAVAKKATFVIGENKFTDIDNVYNKIKSKNQ